jgi:protein-tyrosine phosphatase
MLNDDQLGFSGVSGTDSREPQGILDTLVDQTLQPGYSAAQYMIDVYQQLIASKQSQHSLRRFFDVLLTHQDGAVLYHCNGGKDRTGILTALVLTALGVPWNTVVLDYMGTNERVKKNLERSACITCRTVTRIPIPTMWCVLCTWRTQVISKQPAAK